MSTLVLAVPEDLGETLNKGPGELAQEVRVAAAAAWYSEGVVSQGKAADLAGLSRAEFLRELSRRRISVIQLRPEELRDELASSWAIGQQ